MSCITYKIKNLCFPPDYTGNSFFSLIDSFPSSFLLCSLSLTLLVYIAYLLVTKVFPLLCRRRRRRRRHRRRRRRVIYLYERSEKEERENYADENN